MTQQQLDLLIELIDSKINEFNARNCDDGGLMERIQARQIIEELQATIIEQC